MAYTKADMVYTDYKWTARSDHDDPAYKKAQENSELNRSEGYEMLYFINTLAKRWNWPENSREGYRKTEKLIRNHVPSSIRTKSAITSWIETNYSRYWETL